MNIADWIGKWAVATPDQVAIRFEGNDIGYAEFDCLIRAHAQVLRNALGVQTGDRIACLAHNQPAMLALLFACARLGAVFVPLNWRLAAEEHQRMLQDCGASLLFVDLPFAQQCGAIDSALPGCRFVAMQGPGGGGWPSLPELLAGAAGADREERVDLENPLLIIYTSGTTGFPKGAVLSQRAVQTNAFNSVLLHEMRREDRILTVLPLFHVGGINVQTTPGFYVGATVILHRVFDPRRLQAAIVSERPTLTIILPAHMPALRELPGWDAMDFSCLRGVLTGSSSIPEEMTRYWHGRGIPLLNMYGASETCPIAIHQSVANAFDTEGSIGYPAMHCEVRIVDEQGEACACDQPGEIQVRGSNVMSFYWGNEDATRATLRDGWFATGDIGKVDARGCYHFVDRRKDVIISGGENIYPAEIENLLLSHPEIIEVAVVGRKDEHWGEVPVAVIVSREGSSLDRETVLAWFAGHLGRYKHPKDIVFVEALPRNEMRKVMKHVLRDRVNG